MLRRAIGLSVAEDASISAFGPVTLAHTPMQSAHTPTEGPELPSTTALSAFEAVLRHGSFTGAARELDRTQGAVSRQIAALEAHIGRELFRRSPQGVQPTRAGARFGRELAPLLARLAAVIADIRTEDEGRSTLRLSLLPTFGTTWLIPRLPDFLRAHPEVALQVSTSIGPVDFGRGELDAAIHLGEGSATNARAEPLFEELEVAVCAPTAAARWDLREPGHLNRAELLHLSSRPMAWSRWLEHHGTRGVDATGGPRFEHHLMVLEAARAGLGVALLPSFVADPALRSGELVEPFGLGRRATGRRYWLLVPDRSLELVTLRAFRSWLRRAIEREGW